MYCWGSPVISARQKTTDHPSSGLPFTLPKGSLSAVADRLAIRPEGSEFYRRHKPLYHGHVMHRILADIVLAKDIEPALERYVSGGIVTRDEAIELADRLSVVTSDSRLSRWFDGSGRVLNEQDILLPEGEQRRPDRIILYDDHTDIVDYKFGAVRKVHHAQMENYIRLLVSMGYPSVRGYLWYLPNNEIVGV